LAYSPGEAAIFSEQPVRIERMIRGVFDNEMIVKDAEGSNDPEMVELAFKRRDNHLQDLRHVIDYSLNTLGYEDAPCRGCASDTATFPKGTTAFIEAVGGDGVPVSTVPMATTTCTLCRGLRVVRLPKEDDASKAAKKRIAYFQKVLDTTILCAKVRARTADSSEAYEVLEKDNMALIAKFSSEKQTSLEGEDAAQGAKMGIFDAALRFDPTRPECAQFVTVAYNWAYRNSRARRDGEKRAGVYAQSVDAMVSPDDGSKFVDTVCAGESGFGSFVPQEADRSVVLDIREKVLQLPEEERVVVMAMMAGHTIATAADHLGLPRAKVKQIRDRAYSGLRDEFEGYLGRRRGEMVEAVRD
jgi:DNA-directed RNA polymerase specialized sigma24 family protein